MNKQPRLLFRQSFLGRKVSQHLSDFHCRNGCRSGIDLDLSRRTFIQGAAGAAGLALTSSLWIPRLARADDDADDDKNAQPKPIPGGVSPFGIFIHHVPVTPTATPIQNLTEPSQISDFKGFVGLNRIRGAGTGTGFASPLAFQADMGFMKGVFIGEDGEQHHGSFVFI